MPRNYAIMFAVSRKNNPRKNKEKNEKPNS